MKLGITLPQFSGDAEMVMATARAAEAAGLEGLFAFDHLWPIGRPDRPALHGLSLVAALAVETERVAVGTLVARVGLLPDGLLVHTFATLHRMAGARLVAGLGVGDHLSRAENRAYGVPFRPRDERLASLAEVCRQLRALGITTWVGGTGAATTAVARAEADGLNLWGVTAEHVAAAVAAEAGALEVTWAGQIDLAQLTIAELSERLRLIGATGTTWAVVAPIGVGWPEAVESLAAASAALVD